MSQSGRAPIPPELPAAIADGCPPLPELPDGLLATVATGYALAALEYASCQARHARAVAAYDAARAAAIKNNRPVK
jgi:hypothetical protein